VTRPPDYSNPDCSKACIARTCEVRDLVELEGVGHREAGQLHAHGDNRGHEEHEVGGLHLLTYLSLLIYY